jgi:hypothetical protein
MPFPMSHPAITDYPDGYPLAVDEDQALLMEGRGWVRVENEAVDYSRLTKGPLLDEADRWGIDVPDKVTVPALRRLLEVAQNERLALLNESDTSGVADESNKED